MEKTRPDLGVTLYSFTNAWQQRLFDLEALITHVAEVGLGPAVEAVGFQSFRTYPDVTPEFASYFRNLLEQHDLKPSCLGANVDIGIRKGEIMTSEETLDYIGRQIDTACKLGFPVIRIQTFGKPEEYLGNIIPLAEKAEVHVAIELHAPLTLDHPELIELLEYYQKIQTPFLGFIPDFSASMTSPPKIYWETLREMGAEEALIEEMKNIWKMDSPTYDKFEAVDDAADKYNANPALHNQLRTGITMFGHMPVEDWRVILPYVKHIHGKFYEMTPEGIEPSIPYPQLMRLLKDVEYSGTISAEWEGHAFTSEPIGFSQVKSWNTMCKELLTK